MLTSQIFNFLNSNWAQLPYSIAVFSFHPLSAAVFALKVILITIFKLLLTYRPFHNYTFFRPGFLFGICRKLF